MRVPHNVDDGSDVIPVTSLLEGLYANLAAVRNLLLVVEENLFPYDLRGKESEVLVSKCVLVIPRRALRQPAYNRIEYAFEVESLLSACRYDLRLGKLLLPIVHQLQDLLLVADVYLVDNHNHRTLDTLKLGNIFYILVRLLNGVRDIQYDIGIPDGDVNKVHHILLQAI